MFKRVRSILKKNKDRALLLNELKHVKGNKHYLEYLLNFQQHIINPKEDIGERVYDVVNYIRNARARIASIGAKKIKNGSIILSDNSSITSEIINKAKSDGKNFEVYPFKQSLIKKADVIFVGKPVNTPTFHHAHQYHTSIFFCVLSLNTKKINENITGIISELGIHKSHIFKTELV